jgi:AAA15 family ATPase/GTPase
MNIQSLNVNLDNFKLDIEDFKNLTILVGKNNSGKTTVLEFAVFMCNVVQTRLYIIEKHFNITDRDKILNSSFFAQIPKIYKNIFGKDSTGTIKITFSNGYFLEVTLENSVITNYKDDKNLYPEQIVNINFLSKTFRLFSNADIYLSMRSLLISIDENLTDDILYKLMESYKYYDIENMEKFISKLKKKGSLKLSNEILKDFRSEEDDIEIFDELLIKDNKFFLKNDKKTVQASELSSGNQVINMMYFNSIL